MRLIIPSLLLALIFLPQLSHAAGSAADAAGTNMAWIAIAAALVFIMQVGFALLESGMSRAKNCVNVLMKNYMDLCVGSLVFWCIGYGLMFGTNISGFFGTDHFFPEYINSEFGWGFILFQIMFAATATTIASGAMAERTNFIAYLIGAVVITGVIYPIYGSWVWNENGWLSQMGFVDFAGSTAVHSVGAWCALAGIIVIGARVGRFDSQGKPREIRGHNLNFVALGGFLLWFGWFGFNGGSTLRVSEDIGLINLNTQLSACAGAIAVMLLALLSRKRLLLTDTVNGCLAGLVAITAGCATMAPLYALLTGLIGGLFYMLGLNLLLKLRLDDVVGAVAVHGFAGAWGTLAAGLFYQGDLFNIERVTVQAIGIGAGFLWVMFAALAMYLLIDILYGLRADSQQEQRGLDLSEHAEIAYPEFTSQTAYSAQRASHVEIR